MVFCQALEEDADAFGGGKMLANARFEVLAIPGSMPSAPIAKAEPCRNDDEVLRIFAITKRFAADIARFIETADAEGAQHLEHAPFLPGEYAPFDDYFYCHCPSMLSAR